MSCLPLQPGKRYRLNNGQELTADPIAFDPDHVTFPIHYGHEPTVFSCINGQSVGSLLPYYVVCEVEDNVLRLPLPLYKVVAEHTGLTAMEEERKAQDEAYRLRTTTPVLDLYEHYKTMYDLGEWEPE